MEAVPWTVAAWQQRRRETRRAIRVWLLLLIVGVAGFCVPFYSESKKVKVESAGSRIRGYLSLDDMTRTELIISVASFVIALTGVVGTFVVTQRHYRCPKCEEIPMGSWTTFGPNLFGRQSGVSLLPSICPNCGARLSR